VPFRVRRRSNAPPTLLRIVNREPTWI